MYMYKCRSVVLALVSHPQWPKAMRHTFEYEGKETTPFRYMIRTMPGKGVRVRGCEGYQGFIQKNLGWKWV
jgi:hypothetical protein